jgi:DNA-binding CsgD family transcriptional regulator
MDEVERTSQLIGDIYDAAIDPTLWPSVLEGTCGYIGGVAATLLSQDSVHRAGQFHFSWGDDPHYTKLYLEKYVKINPLLVPTIISAQIREIVTVADLVPVNEYYTSRFYKEWAQPQGYLDAIHGVIDKSTARYAAVAVARHESDGPFDEHSRRRMALLLPHFRRSVTIGKTIDLAKVEAAALADTLDGLATAMFLVDADARLIHANVRGHALLDQATVINTGGGRLTAVDPQASQALQVVFAAAAAGDRAVGTQGIAVPLRASTGEPWIANVLPLTAGARRRAGAAYAAVAAVFVRKAQFDLPHPIETIAAHYKLTPAELRVLMAIVEIGGVPEVAPVLGISESTVKTHLQRVFEKTGTSRQADLVKLVAGFMNPLSAPAAARLQDSHG